MKKLLAFFLFLPLAASAQQLRLGVGPGINSRLSLYRHNPQTNPTSITGAVSLSYLHPVRRHFEIGAEVAATNWRNRANVLVTTPTNPTGGESTVKLDIFIGHPAVSYGIMANYHPRFGRHSVRVGLYGGGVHAWGKTGDEPFGLPVYFPSSNGLVFGGQAGYEFAVTRRIALGLECTPRYARITVDHPASAGMPAQRANYSLWYFPVLLNAGFRL